MQCVISAPREARRIPVDNSIVAEDDKVMNDLTRQMNFDTTLKSGLSDIRIEFAHLRREMAKMQSEMHKKTSDLIKWGCGIAIAIIGTTVGLLTYINKTTDRPAPVAQPPAVYYVQPGPRPVAPAVPPK